MFSFQPKALPRRRTGGAWLKAMGRAAAAGWMLSLLLAAGCSDSDGTLIRLPNAPAGELDPTFNQVGYVTHDNAAGGSGPVNDVAPGLAVLPSGDIVASGFSLGPGGYNNAVLYNYTEAGQLNTAFGGGDGIFVFDPGAHAEGLNLTVDDQGRFVVPGVFFTGTDNDMAVIRVDSNGTLDTSFSGDGLFNHDGLGGGNDTANSAVIDGSGNIVICGRSSDGAENHAVIWRLDSSGFLDTTFGGTGWVTFDVSPTFDEEAVGCLIDDSGRIVASGNVDNGTDDDAAVWRFNSDGSLDTSFGGVGYVTFHDIAGGAADDNANFSSLDPSGRILTAGFSSNGTDFDGFVLRLESDGSPDSTFGSGGFAVFDFGNNSFDRMFIPRVDFWGNIVVAGFVSGPVGVNIDMAVWRYLADGSLDPSFANGAGFLTHHNAAGGNGADLALNLAFDAQGRIVLSGYSTNSVPDLDATIWRIR